MKKIDSFTVQVEVFEIDCSDSSEQNKGSQKGYSRNYSQQWDRIFGDKKEEKNVN